MTAGSSRRLYNLSSSSSLLLLFDDNDDDVGSKDSGREKEVVRNAVYPAQCAATGNCYCKTTTTHRQLNDKRQQQNHITVYIYN